MSEVIIVGKPVVHWEITGKDGKRLQKFYAELFDWKIDANNPMEYGIVETGGKGINGGIATAQQGSAGGITFYVEVEDLDEYLRTAERLGGKTLLPPSEVPGTQQPIKLAMFADPEGNRIGLLLAGTMQ